MSIAEADDCYDIQNDGGDGEDKSQADKYKDEMENFESTKGINRERGCTDILFLIIWLAFLGSMGYLTNYGFQNGHVNKLLAPLDGDKSFCGWKNATRAESAGGPYDYSDHPKLLITDYSALSLEAIFNSGVCVKECPSASGFTNDCQTTSHVEDCNSEEIAGEMSEMISIMNICIPTEIPESAQVTFALISSTFTESAAGSAINDLDLSQKAINISILMGIVYSLAFIYLMSAFAETIAWIIVILVEIALIGLTVYSYMMYDQEMDKYQSLEATFSGSGLEQKLEESEAMQTKYIGLLSGCGIMCLTYTCAVFCNWDSLKKAIDVIDAAADFLAGTKRVIFVPALFFFFSLIAITCWLGSMACVVSLNEIYPSEIIPQGKDLVWDQKVTYMALYMLFGILWITAFFEYCSTFVVMVSASTYYFNSNPQEEGQAEVGLGFTYAVYHSGSIAIGAFIIALVRFIRIVFYYLAKQAEKQSGDNPVVKNVVRAAECVLACIEKICDYINQSAYAYMAVSGDSFCSSALSAFILNLKHMGKFVFANLLAKMFIIIGKISITAINIVSFYYIMKFGTKNLEEGDNQVNSVFVPLIVVGVISFMTASIFLGLFDTSVMALLTSLAIDMDNNSGQPVFGPPTFHEKSDKMSGDKAANDMMEGGEYSGEKLFKNPKMQNLL